MITMSLIIFYLTVWCLTNSISLEKTYYDIEKAEELFKEFVLKYNKTYASNDEKQERFEIFSDNLMEINYLNSFNDAIHGINMFADLTKNEFEDNYMGFELPKDYFQSSCRIITDADLMTNEAPEALDYRDSGAVTEVKNQLKCQSCWAFSSIGSIEGQYAIKHGKLLSLSEQQLMDCLQCSGHCARGSYMVQALSELMRYGVELGSDYPYVGRDLRCQYDRTKVKVTLSGCYNFRLRDEDRFREALFKFGPIAIAVNGNGVQHYNGGIKEVRNCPPTPITHGVLLVGYGAENGKNYWIIKNSWGSAYGEKGYVRISKGHNTCGLMNEHAASAVVA